ncbi:aminotransferase class V-fold PLP-dependent enzyme [Lapidilactobacillus gannanensis]|jgi:cysteine desulfurase/selenocysteine lyase|uniref:Cysteine desulfurase n=1 Tax=Lapidilactobacillus gannanensis TaxID=2486002 RepID=A0ABW4BMF4_9LACO|nr:cysteine desulfurase [Lapidilactobacillus gannanensis]MCH4057772.1 cysteine desulfurase [Lactobacillaceae bacterium]
MVKDIATARNDFPLLATTMNQAPITYLDNAATTQKPQPVIDRLIKYYQTENVNVQRGVYALAQATTTKYEQVRQQVADFLNAQPTEIVFTRGTTTSLNWVAQSFAPTVIQPDDEILITIMEHHSNLVPWQIVAQKLGARLRYVELDDAGHLDLKQLQASLTSRTKIVALTHVSNVLGTINPIKQITTWAHRVGAYVVVDGAQAVGHLPVDVQDLDCDFYAFSGHKVYGPTGIGVLYGKAALLAQMPPVEYGGEMINLVTRQTTDFKPAPAKFEAGTMPIAQVIGLGAALDYLTSLGWSQIMTQEQHLLQLAGSQLQAIPGVTLYGPALTTAHSAVLSFNLAGVHPHDLATVLDSQGVAIRAGHHCAQPLMTALQVSATARASFAFYNNDQDVERLITAVKMAKEFFQA